MSGEMDQPDNTELLLQALEHAVEFESPEWATKARDLVRDMRDPERNRNRPTVDIDRMAK